MGGVRGLSLLPACVAEAIGTFLLVLFGTGAVAASVMTDAHMGLWQVAVVWAIGVSVSIYVTSSTSGALLNLRGPPEPRC